MMKVVSFDKEPRPRAAGALFGLLSLPVFAVIFYLLYSLVARTSPASAVLIVLAGAGFLGYLAWSFFRSRR
jgi:threonine/homoserine/homoserine lactone efflux protein